MVNKAIVIAGFAALATAKPHLLNLQVRQDNSTLNGTLPSNSTLPTTVLDDPEANKAILPDSKVEGDLARKDVDPTKGKPFPENFEFVFFKGDGSKEAKWPTEEDWISYDDMFERNSKFMGTGCVAGVPENTPEENEIIKAKILDVAAAAEIDPRFILATVMQESNGCVRVKGTPSGEPGVFNPGMLQTFKGTGTCNKDNDDKGQSPCPAAQIVQMLVDGVQGVNTPDASGEIRLQAGLVQRIAEAKGKELAQVYYQAARLYNSGAVAEDGALETAGKCEPRSFGVPCYSADIANRMLGWTNEKTACDVEPEVCA